MYRNEEDVIIACGAYLELKEGGEKIEDSGCMFYGEQKKGNFIQFCLFVFAWKMAGQSYSNIFEELFQISQSVESIWLELKLLI